MTQPPPSERGPAEEPAREPEVPGRDPRLAGFAQGGGGDTCPPSAALAAVVEELSGPGWRCGGADDDELVGLLGRWEALGAWAEAAKLGVVRELIRRRARPGPGGYLPVRGDLPDQWHAGVGHEVSAALGISVRSADNLVVLAWDLQARLPGTGAALAAGLLSPLKAKIICEELKVLGDDLAGQAEKLILDQVTALTTPGQVGKLAARTVCTVDPDGAVKRRGHAERERARIAFWRDNGGACAMAAYGLPTDAALAANDAIEHVAWQYKSAKIRPEARMDQLRVLAFLDLLNGITVQARIGQDRAAQAARDRQAQARGADRGDTGGRGDSGGRGGSGRYGPAGEPGTTGPSGDGHADDSDYDGDGDGDSDYADDSPYPDGDYPDGDDYPDDGDHGDGGDGDGSSHDGTDPGSAGRSGNPGAPGGNGGGKPPNPAPAPDPPALTARANLTFPLATLLGLADRPGAAHGLGPLDPALVRDLAAGAANSPHSQWCITITGPDGAAIAHGCAKPARTPTATPPPASRDGPPGGTPWALTRREEPGPPGGYGTWTLTLPGGRDLTVKLQPIPVSDCDHRHESHGYQPSDTLRHLVQVRDGTCTYPTCSRHARDTDFEHTTPHHKGGRTCACNGAARSRRCHRVKQSQGWTVTQPQPGHHQWTTPSGRTYTQGPMRYPA